MFKDFIKQLEKRADLELLIQRFPALFETHNGSEVVFSKIGFAQLLDFLVKGETSLQAEAVQAGVRWSSASQKVPLRNTIRERGFVTPSCLWAHRSLRGAPELLLKDFATPEMSLMQILLLKEVEPRHSAPFLVERYLNQRGGQEELVTAARLCILRLLDAAGSPELIASLQSRYGGVEILNQWRPAIPRVSRSIRKRPGAASVDFHEILRSVHDMKGLSSLTRTLYVVSQFYVPLSEREWESLLLSDTDHQYFERLSLAGIVQSCKGGFMLTGEASKRDLVRKFLYESYSLAKQTVRRNKEARRKEEREHRVKTSELDRQALEMLPTGIVCVESAGRFYYMNPAAEGMLADNAGLRAHLFGKGPLEEELAEYTKDRIISRITSNANDNGSPKVEVFGDRASILVEGKRYELDLRPQVILLRDTTDQYLVDQEVAKLYRHELKAALDVIGVGLDTAKDLLRSGRSGEGLDCLEQVEEKRADLAEMLEERIDFIRLHSDAFRIRPGLVNLNLVVDRCISDYQEGGAAKGVSIKSNHLQVQGVMVHGEERFLIRAISNIVRNAVKFCDKGNAVTVSIASQGAEAALTISDDGPGIPKENLGKIFRLGFTTGGSGRGLYLARRIIAAHGGRIDVKSKPGHGASFCVKLPLVME